MRVFISDRGPRFQPPPEQINGLWNQFAEWRQRWRDKMECFEFFVDGNGGFAIVNVADENELQQMMIEYPFAQFDEMEVRPIRDGDASLENWRHAIEQQMARL
jgi:hypothetical protein